MNVSSHSARHHDAFTITDLLFVILTLALLAIVVLPSFAGVQNKGGRLQCANNLRQIGQDSMVYAGENNGWLPVCTLGGANGEGTKSNYLGGVWYSEYIYSGATIHTQITTNEPSQSFGNGYQNLGYLYRAGLVGNGNILYCPAAWGFEQTYEPLLTSDGNGIVNSTYFYNPRMVNAFANNTLRRYQKVSQLEPHKLFSMDLLLSGASSAGVSPASFAHARDHGLNVLFTDGSVQFDRLSSNNNYYYNLIVNQLVSNESAQSYEEYDQVFNFLEQDH
jgi:prepilin-type processing-associated H-X9-DG protein